MQLYYNYKKGGCQTFMKKYYDISLDLGTNSIGWGQLAVILNWLGKVGKIYGERYYLKKVNLLKIAGRFVQRVDVMNVVKSV